MSRSTLEQVLELLINEENGKAEELLHDFVVEQARQIHEASLNESDNVVEEELEEIEEASEEVEEGFDLESESDEIEADADEIENEEIYDEDDMEDDEAVDDLEMGDDAPEGDMEDRVDDLESALADLEAEFEKIMSGEEDDMEDEGEEADAEMEESLELDLEEAEEVEEDLEESDETETDLEESEEDEQLDEYVTPVTASTGDNGDASAKTTVNANPKRPGDDSNAKPVGQNDGNTSGGKGDAPKDMSTGNVNVSGNSKAPAMSPKSASEGDNGANTKSVSS